MLLLSMTLPNASSLTDIPPQGAPPMDAPLSTVGQNIHKWGTYLSVDWVLNTALGVSFAYATKYTELGKKCWSEPITAGFTKALAPLIKDEVQLAKSAGYGNMFMSIIAGGMLTIPPLLLLENKGVKESIVKSIDKAVYGEERVESNPQLQMSYATMGEAPKKEFGTGMIARFAALAPLLAIVLIPATKKASNAAYFNHVEHSSEALARAVGLSEESLSHVSPQDAAEKWKFIHESIAMDFGLGLPYAGLHSFFCDKIAAIAGHSKAQDAVRGQDVPPPEAVRLSATESDIPSQGAEVVDLTTSPTRTITQATHETARAQNSHDALVYNYRS
jgi:hypothetical protein